MNYEMFLQGPEVYIPIILISLVVTVIAYGAFPFIYARLRKNTITKKQYNRRCYGFNLLVMVVFCIVNGEPSNGGPYLLWTWIFAALGLRTLQSRGVLDGFQFENNESIKQAPASQTTVASTEPVSSINQSAKFPVEKQIPPLADSDSQRQYIASCQPSKSEKTYKSLLWVMVILVALCLAVALFQNFSMRSQLDALNAENNSLKNTVADHEETISTQKKTIGNLKKKADTFDDISDSLSYGNIGTAAYNFKAEESIVVVRKNETDRKIKLTAHWSSGGTVSVSYSSNAASIDFDKDSWSTSTTLTVIPRYVGATVVTFTNDVNTDRFKILIIVTD